MGTAAPKALGAAAIAAAAAPAMNTDEMIPSFIVTPNALIEVTHLSPAIRISGPGFPRSLATTSNLVEYQPLSRGTYRTHIYRRYRNAANLREVVVDDHVVALDGAPTDVTAPLTAGPDVTADVARSATRPRGGHHNEAQ